MNKIALITGATAGIGKACAAKLASANFNIIITGRRNERLILLKAELEKEYGIKVLPLCFDVQNRQAVTEALTNLPRQWQKIDILINNAGTVSAIRVDLDITHSYIGDLIVRLTSPRGTPAILHERNGASAKNIIKSFNLQSTPALSRFNGESANGNWTLEAP